MMGFKEKTSCTLHASHSHRSCFCCGFRHVRITTHGDRMAPAGCGPRDLRPRSTALSGILGAVDRPDMRRVSIKVRAPGPKFLVARIDPLPQLYGRGESVQTRFPFYAHEIGRKPVTVAAAAAAAMI